LPKDNENIPFLGPVEPLEPQGFSAEQMIRCEECLQSKSSDPSKLSVLCRSVAPDRVVVATAQAGPAPPEKHQLGYNNILLPPRGQLRKMCSEVAAAFETHHGERAGDMAQTFRCPSAAR
jgi:hypothetical protein